MHEALHTVTETTDAITSRSAVELARLIEAGELSAREVVEVHIRRIEAVNGSLNAVVVRLFDDALRAAAFADEVQARGKPLGPLHGVPVTIKEMFDVAGTATTAGLTELSGTFAKEDAPLVQQLRRAGAIVLGKTNVPQLGMLYESDNPLYGRTNNPWNLDRSPGGSSGGEAAIIAARGSPLGLGSDGGGSIRQPAHVCGICGIKPTSGRLTMAGHFPCPNWHSDWLQPGPMARSVEDLSLALRVLSESGDEAGDVVSSLSPLAGKAISPLQGLRVGFYSHDGYLRPAPAVRRAVKEAADALTNLGAEVEEFQPPDIEEALRIYFSLFLADGLASMRGRLKGSRPDWRIRRLLLGAQVPSAFRPPLIWLHELFGQHYVAQMSRWCAQSTLAVAEYWHLLEEQTRYRRRFLRELAKGRFHVILCPPNALPALPHGSFYAGFTGSYTVLYNLLGMPAGVVSATRVRDGEESDCGPSRDFVIRAAKTAERGSVGLPIGVQVVAAHRREDTALAVMAALEECFRSQQDYPDCPPSFEGHSNDDDGGASEEGLRKR